MNRYSRFDAGDRVVVVIPPGWIGNTENALEPWDGLSGKKGIVYDIDDEMDVFDIDLDNGNRVRVSGAFVKSLHGKK